MTGTAFFFVIVGVGVVSANLMKLVEWLDTPRDAARRGRRPAARAVAWDEAAYQSAELELESALYAA